MIVHVLFGITSEGNAVHVFTGQEKQKLHEAFNAAIAEKNEDGSDKFVCMLKKNSVKLEKSQIVRASTEAKEPAQDVTPAEPQPDSSPVGTVGDDKPTEQTHQRRKAR